MPAATLMHDDTCAGTVLTPPQSKVFILGLLWAVVGTPIEPHPPCWDPNPPHCSAVMVGHSTKVTIAGLGVCREGDLCSCGHSASGTPRVFAGG